MDNEATTKTPIPTRSGFRNFALCTCLHPDPLGLIFALPNPLSLYFLVPLCLSGQDPRSTLVETPLQISLFFAKQSQFQNGQNDHKYCNTKGLCQRTTSNEQRTLFKTNPIKPNSSPYIPSEFAQKSLSLSHIQRHSAYPGTPAPSPTPQESQIPQPTYRIWMPKLRSFSALKSLMDGKCARQTTKKPTPQV